MHHREARKPSHPSTPDVHLPISKRHFDSMIRVSVPCDPGLVRGQMPLCSAFQAWRRALHKWDPEANQGEIPAEAIADEALKIKELDKPATASTNSASHPSLAASVVSLKTDLARMKSSVQSAAERLWPAPKGSDQAGGDGSGVWLPSHGVDMKDPDFQEMDSDPLL